MSEASAQPTDSKASKRPNFVRQLSKSYEKSKEAMKRNLLTPRGPRTAKSAELPLPETKADAPSDSAAQVAPAPAAPTAQKAVAGDAHTIKVDIKATHDATTPVELLVEPANKGASVVHKEPATTPAVEPSAPAPQSEVHTPAAQADVKAPVPQAEVKVPAPQPEEPAQPVQKEMPSLAAESPVEPVEQAVRETHKLPETPVQTHIEVPADVSCAPPAVSVTIKGAPDNAEEPKAARKTFTPEPAREKKGRGLRRALIGLAAIAAGGFAVMHARH